MRSAWRRLAWMLILGCCLVAPRVQAEIYRWVDEGGRMHFAQDLGKVPPQYRAAAKGRATAPKGRDPIQHYTPPAPAQPRAVTTRSGATGGSAGKVHKIRVERAGSSMRVVVTLNDFLDVPFLLDTGASDVSVPLWAAEKLGIPIEGEGVRTNRYGTANGFVDSAVIRLDSVSVGTARVENVVGSVSKSMKIGLLGLSFLNHFNYSYDANQGLVTLTENSLKDDGLIRGGRSERQWRTQFASLRRRIERADKALDEIAFGRARKRARAEEAITTLRRHLEVLEDEADDNRVPFGWRE